MRPLLASFVLLANARAPSTLPIDGAFTSVPGHGESGQKQKKESATGKKEGGRQEGRAGQSRQAREARQKESAQAALAPFAAQGARQTAAARRTHAAAHPARLHKPV